MSEHRKENVAPDSSSPAQAHAPAQASSSDPESPGGPTAAERARLVRALQAQALTEDNPLAANLGVLKGDLISVAHGMAPVVKDLHSSPARAASKAAAKYAERFLRTIAQINRTGESYDRHDYKSEKPRS